MILLTHWKGYQIEWIISGYKAVREYDGYRLPTIFRSIDQAKNRINSLVN